MLDTAGACSFGTKEIIPEGGTPNSQYFSRTSIFKSGCYSTQMGAVAPSGTREVKATLFDHMSVARSRKLLGVRGPHFRVVLFGTQATCAGGYVHISDSIYLML